MGVRRRRGAVGGQGWGTTGLLSPPLESWVAEARPQTCCVHVYQGGGQTGLRGTGKWH